MRAKNIFSIIVVLSALIIGVRAVGQQKAASKFESYLRPASISVMDFAVLRANVDLVRRGGLTNDSTPAIVSYNAGRDEIDATVFVDRIGKQPLDKAKGEIEQVAKNTLWVLRHYIPELREEDFVLEVDWLRIDPITESGGQEVFAEYRNGKIAFK